MDLQLTVFNPLYTDDIVANCFTLLGQLEEEEKATIFVSQLLHISEVYGLEGNLWQGLVLHLVMYHENVFTLSLERKKDISNALELLTKMDIQKIYALYHLDFSMIEETKRNCIYHFVSTKPVINKEIHTAILLLQKTLANCQDIDSFYNVLCLHFFTYGVGKYGLNKAFRYEFSTIQPIIHIGNNTLDQLIGCESQKQRLIENTEAFLQGKAANNVLLYGDSGTGKSSSIKALLNAYYKDGLRMIEIYKHQFKYLPTIIQELQSRNYKFIIFMDDLSFEDFEIEYKYLKAVIEGGLESKPDNILIYATSNRRHLIKQTWKDRQYDDEVSINDAMQEKLSLSSRFGISILFVHPDKIEYLRIVDGLAKQYGVTIDTDILHEQALAWELRHGGYSGRTAQQFIHMLLSK